MENSHHYIRLADLKIVHLLEKFFGGGDLKRRAGYFVAINQMDKVGSP